MTTPRPDLAAVLDLLQDSVTVQDAGGRVVYANMVAARRGGFSTPEELLKSDPAEYPGRYTLFDEHGAPFPWDRLPGRLVLAGLDAPDVLIRYHDETTDEDRWAIFHAAPLPAEDGTRSVVNVIRDVTEQVTAEKGLEELRRFEQGIAAASPAILYVYDWVQQRSVYTNSALARILGYSHDEMVEGMGEPPFTGLLHPEDQERLPEMAAELIAATDGAIVEHIFRLRHANGEWCWISARQSILTRTPDGWPHLMVGAALDISKQRASEDALRESEARYRAVVESQTEMICRFTSDTTLTFVNDAYCRGFARKRENVLGRRSMDLASESIRQRLSAHFQTLVAEARPVEIEHPIELRDGTIRLQHWIDYPVYDTAGNVTEYQGIGRDVTELRRAEQELAASRRLADRVGAASPEILYVFDVIDSRTVYVNDAIGRVLGYTAKHLTEAEDSDPMAFRHPGDRATLQAAMTRISAAADGEVVEFSFRMRHSDGSWRWLAARVTVLSREPDGRPRQVVGAALDITALRETEATLRRLSHQLLKAQDDERRRLARELHDGVAQDVFAITVALDSIEQGSQRLSTRSREVLAEAQNLAEHALRALRTRAYLLHPPLLDMAGLAPTLREYAAELARRGEFNVDASGVEDVGRLGADVETALFRVAQEALSNVVRHAGADRVTLTLKSRGGVVELRVHDQGKGRTSTEPSLATHPNGVGIPGMRERLRQISGTLEVATGPGWTTVTARAPMKPSDS